MSQKIEIVNIAFENTPTVPIAKISQVDAKVVLGGAVRLDGAPSISSDGRDLSYTWTILTGPSLSPKQIFGEEDYIDFLPLYTGIYTIQLVVSTDRASSAPVKVTCTVKPSLVEVDVTDPPDGNYFFDILSDFWKLVDKKEAYPILWSGYSQLISADIFKALQIDDAKSVNRINSVFQRRWKEYSSLLDVSSMYKQLNPIKYLTGTKAKTLSSFRVEKVFFSSPSSIEFVNVNNEPITEGIGSDFSVSSKNFFTKIISLNTSSTGYDLQSSFPFTSSIPNLNITFQINTDLIYSSSFPSINPEVGQIIKVGRGPKSGKYTITEVYSSSNSIPNDKYVRVNSTSSITRQEAAILYFTFDAEIKLGLNPFISSLFIPTTELSLSDLNKDVSGLCTIIDPYKIQLEHPHRTALYIGKPITITISGINYTTTLSEFYPKEGTYSISVSLDIMGIDLSVVPKFSYFIPNTVSPKDFCITTQGQTFQIKDCIQYNSSLIQVIVDKTTLLTEKFDFKWEINPTIEFTENVEDMGVTAGDILYLEVFRTDLNISSLIPCTVVGTSNNFLAFKISEEGLIQDKEVASIGAELALDTAYKSQIDGVSYLHMSSTAQDIYDEVHSLSFLEKIIDSSLYYDSTLNINRQFNVTVIPKTIVRNSRIKVSNKNEITSIPYLTEYIHPIDAEEGNDGKYYAQLSSQEILTLEKKPVSFYENVNYILSASDLKGDDASVSSGIINLPYADLVNKKVKPFDTIILYSTEFIISEVINDQQLRALAPDTFKPPLDNVDIPYRVIKQLDGQYLEFIQEYSYTSPAPLLLWAPYTFYTNNKYIEDNFGSLVSYTQKVHNDFNPSQVTYKNAVKALAYSWTKGPSVEAIKLGAHIFAGLPVTEHPARVVQAYPDYTSTQGLIILEYLKDNLQPLGIFKAFKYDTNNQVTGLFPPISGLAKLKDKNVPQQLSYLLSTDKSLSAGDLLPRFFPLTNAISVYDYTLAPSRYDLRNARELVDSFHKFSVDVNLSSVDSRDFKNIASFLNSIRPAYVGLTIRGILSLLDTITIKDYLTLALEKQLVDDITNQGADTKMLDDLFGSFSQRKFDSNNLNSRVLFRGDDLHYSTFTGQFTSARGGFKAPAAANSALADIAPDMRYLPRINSVFTDPVYVHGTELVQPGDILLILSGKNQGQYIIDSVVDDLTLTVSGPATLEPQGQAVLQDEPNFNVLFYIFRPSSYILSEGTFSAVDASTNIITLDNIDLNTSQVSAGDVFQYMDNYAYSWYYRINKIEYNPITETVANKIQVSSYIDPTLGLKGRINPLSNFLTSYSSGNYKIWRPSLRQKDFVTYSSTNSIFITKLQQEGILTILSATTLHILPGDRVVLDITDSLNIVHTVMTNVIGVVGSNEIVLVDGEILPGISITEYTAKISPKNIDETNDSDSNVEYLSAQGNTDIVFQDPLSFLSVSSALTSADVTLSAETTTIVGSFGQSSATVKAQIQYSSTTPELENFSGVYSIESQNNSQVELKGLIPFPSTGNYTIQLIEEDNTKFTKVSSTEIAVTSPISVTSIKRGDILRYQRSSTITEEHIITGTAPNTLYVTNFSAVVTNFYAQIIRRIL